MAKRTDRAAGSSISRIAVYRQWQPFAAGPYVCRGHREEGNDSTVVVLTTADGSVGLGEIAPLGSFYSAAFADGARAGIALLAPLLIGLDATQPRLIRSFLDTTMLGHPYVKSAFDMACWDLAARRAGQPLCEALGGRYGSDVILYRSVSQDDPAAMAESARRFVADGYRRLQVKVGLEPGEDAERIAAVRAAVGSEIELAADANGGWTTAETRTFLRATTGLEYALEQPCMALEECLAIRATCDRPMILDESIVSLETLLAARRGGADGLTIKLSRVGGITAAALLRDVACELGLPVAIEDTGGAQIGSAAIAHVSLSTPEELRRQTIDFHAWVTVANGSGMPDADGGRMRAPDGPGLGITADLEILGEPIMLVS
jgi:cis-L-3-hydroxyproline dehydratase